MMYMLDTNICIYAIKHVNQIMEHLRQHEPEEICISVITYGELMHGVEKSKEKERNQLALMLLLSNIRILDFDCLAAEEYGNIRADLECKGQVIGPMDMMIAAHARSRNLVLVTNNVKEFERIGDLRLENWAEA